MLINNHICSIDKISLNDAEQYGGKCFGLKKIETLVKIYDCMHHLHVQIPKTFAIPLSFHEEYKKNGRVPESLVTRAMSCVVACGGNVAVRSSANCEDSEDNSYSGVFKSVLHVKTREQMREALNTVYASAEAEPTAKMGILIQQMIDEPKIAGVAYSETWFRRPFVILNYTEGKVADNLVTKGGSEGELFAACKLVRSEFGKDRLSFSNMNDSCCGYGYIPSSSASLHVADVEERHGKYYTQFVLSALISGLEKHLGYPVDVEFAVSKKGTVNILQQRPYLFPNFIEKQIDENTHTTYKPNHPVISGDVKFYNEKGATKSKEGGIVIDDRCGIVDIFTSKSYNDYLNFYQHMNGDVCGTSQNGYYTHAGNMRRVFSDFSHMSTINSDMQVCSGDNMEINLETGAIGIRRSLGGR